MDLSDASPHDVAAVLKEFFRSLPEPLMTRDLFGPILGTRSEWGREEEMEGGRERGRGKEGREGRGGGGGGGGGRDGVDFVLCVSVHVSCGEICFSQFPGMCDVILSHVMR